MKRLLSLLLGLTLAASASAADFTAGPFAGPYTIPVNGQFQAIDLNGPAIPAGTYTYVQISAQFNPMVGGNPQFQTDMRVALTNTAVSGVTTIAGATSKYYWSTSLGGAAPTTAVNGSVAGTVLWDSTLDTAFTANGVSTLFLDIATQWLAGTPVQMSGYTVTLSTSTPPLANETCAAALDITPAASVALSANNTFYIAPSALMVGASPAAVAFPSFSCGATVTRTAWYRFQPPATGPYIFQNCNEAGTVNSVANNIIGVYEAGPGGTPCIGINQVACGTLTCTKGAKLSPLVLDSSKVYYVVMGRTGATSLATTEKRYQLRIDRTTPTPTCTFTETEPNDTKAAAQSVTLANTDAICGTTTGNTGAGSTSLDYFKVKTAAHAGIFRNRLRAYSYTAGHIPQIMGLTQTNGVINATEGILQTASSSTNPDRYVQWYTLGNSADPNDRTVTVRVGGVTSTVQPYSMQLTSDVVIPTDLSRELTPGSITITTQGQTGGTQSDTDLWIYDADFNPVGTNGNDDATSLVRGSTLTRTFPNGTFYLALARYNLANNQPSPLDDGYRSASVTEFPGVIVRGDSTIVLPANVSFKITDTTGDVITAASIVDHFDVLFYKLQVGPAGNGGCQPADIADDQGNPLPSANINTGVNEGDYNAFFAGFFTAEPYCDQWDDQGNPLPSNQPNTGVNEGDYNGFFATFFNGCP